MDLPSCRFDFFQLIRLFNGIFIFIAVKEDEITPFIQVFNSLAKLSSSSASVDMRSL